MTRFTLDRAAVQAEVARRKASSAVNPTPPVAPSVPVAPSNRARWSAKVFVVPAAVAVALAKLATRTLFGPVSPQVVGEPHSMRRHRGVYIWRPTMDQQGRTDAYGELVPIDAEAKAEEARNPQPPRRENLH